MTAFSIVEKIIQINKEMYHSMKYEVECVFTNFNPLKSMQVYF